MARVLTLADFRPGERVDGVAWSQVRVEQADKPAGDWGAVKTLSLEPLDANPADPALRSVTIEVEKDWVRLVFLDGEGGEDAPCPMVYAPGPSFRPTLGQVSALMRARTYSSEGNAEDPMSVLPGAALAGEFNATTRPTAEEVEDELIPAACSDLISEIGLAIPGFLIEEVRRAAALKTGAEIERSYIPEQADEGKTTYQTLRLTFEGQASSLRQRLQWWGLERSLGRP
ncbi:MAG TPA: hypothetical protein VFX35_01635 [Solirubrobacterales bacterium]|nr:hypothetical protein [Solirubrobacterales bacterium]